MSQLVCNGRLVPMGPEETALDALLRAGIEVPNACREGACQACVVKATAGTVPAQAQAGLKETQKAQGLLLACQARSPLDLTLTTQAQPEVLGHVAEVEPLGADVLRVWIELQAPFDYEAGQFITLLRADGLARSYSIANPPDGRGRLELHVRVLPHGRMSAYLASAEAHGQAVRVRGPAGTCFYVAGRSLQPLLLVGTGTGLAPLLGVLKSALASGHTGPITLIHGARMGHQLYLRDELEAYARQHPNLRYLPSALEAGSATGIFEGALDALLDAQHPVCKGHRIFLCGDPLLVNKLKRRFFLAGTPLADIFADAFITAPTGDISRADSDAATRT